MSPAHLDTAESYVGTKEATGHNDGPAVSRFLRSVGLPEGYSWCAAFVSYCLSAVHAASPATRSARALAFYGKGSHKAADVVTGKYKPRAGDIVIFRRGVTAYGHVGFVVWYKSPTMIETVEGNTSPNAASIEQDLNGEGVFEKARKIEPGNYFRIIGFTNVRER